MKLCPECKSDNIERTSSTGLRVFACIVLLFIPYGFIICWVPFVFSHTFTCKNCGNTGKENELIQIDWREREQISEEFKKLQEKASIFSNKWFKDFDGNLYKIALSKTQPMVIKVENKALIPYRITDLEIEGQRVRINIKKNKSPYKKILLTYYDVEIQDQKKENNESNLSKFGSTVIDVDEDHAFSNGVEKLEEYLNANDKMLDVEIQLQLEIEKFDS